LSFEQFRDQVLQVVGVSGTDVDPGLDLGRQLGVESAQLTELALLLEQELGMELADDADLRSASIAALYDAYLSESQVSW